VTADSASEDAETDSETDYHLTSDDDDTSSNSDNADESAVKRRKVVRRSVGSSEDGGWADVQQRTVDPLVFTGNSGITTSVQSEEPLTFFEEFVAMSLTDLMVTERNRYATQMTSDEGLSPFSRMHMWVHTTAAELMV